MGDATSVSVQSDDFDTSEILKTFAQNGVGAVVTFTGIVREDDTPLSYLEIEHYPRMCEAAITRFTQEACARFDLTRAVVIHRFGRLALGEQIMMVATSAPHRKAAFEGADYLMDYLKSRAPCWKKEVFQDGSHAWVDAKSSDEDALERW